MAGLSRARLSKRRHGLVEQRWLKDGAASGGDDERWEGVWRARGGRAVWLL